MARFLNHHTLIVLAYILILCTVRLKQHTYLTCPPHATSLVESSVYEDGLQSVDYCYREEFCNACDALSTDSLTSVVGPNVLKEVWLCSEMEDINDISYYCLVFKIVKSDPYFLL